MLNQIRKPTITTFIQHFIKGHTSFNKAKNKIKALRSKENKTAIMQTTCLYISIHILSEYTFNSQYIKIKYMTVYQQKQTANYKMQLKVTNIKG